MLLKQMKEYTCKLMLNIFDCHHNKCSQLQVDIVHATLTNDT